MRRILGFAGGIGLGLGLAFALSKMLRRARTELPGAIVNEARQAATSVGERMRLALEEGRRATELSPVSKDAINGEIVGAWFAMIAVREMGHDKLLINPLKRAFVRQRP